MHDKEKLILEKSIQLFSNKGFKSTSIQEIADECGISKGSFYSYFQSKDALLLETLNYYFSKLEMRLQKIEQLSISPKQKLEKQLAIFVEKISKHKHFLSMHSHVHEFPMNESIQKALFRQQMKTRKWYYNRFLNVYGNEIAPFAWDLAVMLEGMFISFIRAINQKGGKLQSEKLSQYIVNRLDDVAKGLMNSNVEIIFTDKEMKKFFHMTDLTEQERKDRIHRLLNKIKSVFIEKKSGKNCIMAVEVLEEELERVEPREIVIDGMMQNIERKEVEQYVYELKQLLY